MRIIQFILFWAIFLSVVALATFAISQEVLLYIGRRTVSTAVRELQQAQTKGSYTNLCDEIGSEAEDNNGVATYQLRFSDDVNFQTEVVCKQFSFVPTTIQSYSLPKFISKVPGSSGIIIGDQRSGIELAAFAPQFTWIDTHLGLPAKKFQRFSTILFENGRAVTSTATTTDLGTSPVAACENYGYQCCMESAEVGTGEQLLGTATCERSCFQQCKAIPVVLSFMSDPFIDAATRSVNLQAGSPIEFRFVASAGEAETVTGTLDFGDGESAVVSGLAGQATHVYRCPGVQQCSYTAQLRLTDSDGAMSALVTQSQIVVNVSP